MYKVSIKVLQEIKQVLLENKIDLICFDVSYDVKNINKTIELLKDNYGV